MKFRDLLYPLRIVKQVLYLPKIVFRQNSTITELDKTNSYLAKIQALVEQHNDKIDDVDKSIHVLDNKIIDIKHEISTSGVKGEPAISAVPINGTSSDNHSLDHFYKLFEDKFRGTEEDIKQRISEHKPLFDSLQDNLKKLPIVDLGCGRGEFLSFAKDIGLNAVGVDMNHDMVKRTKSLGFVAYETDAMSYISDQKTASIAAITGFHIVEHIPFGLLIKLFEECYRVLSPGGFVLFETPNPQNLIVGACNFYMDPSHDKPIPPELLDFALGSIGFKTKIIPLHPTKEVIEHVDDTIKDMMNLIYGPRDYAVLAKKI